MYAFTFIQYNYDTYILEYIQTNIPIWALRAAAANLGREEHKRLALWALELS